MADDWIGCDTRSSYTVHLQQHSGSIRADFNSTRTRRIYIGSVSVYSVPSKWPAAKFCDASRNTMVDRVCGTKYRIKSLCVCCTGDGGGGDDEESIERKRERERLHRRGEVATEASRGIINSGSRKEPERERGCWRFLCIRNFVLPPPSFLDIVLCVSVCVCWCVPVLVWSSRIIIWMIKHGVRL